MLEGRISNVARFPLLSAGIGSRGRLEDAWQCWSWFQGSLGRRMAALELVLGVASKTHGSAGVGSRGRLEDSWHLGRSIVCFTLFSCVPRCQAAEVELMTPKRIFASNIIKRHKLGIIFIRYISIVYVKILH